MRSRILGVAIATALALPATAAADAPHVVAPGESLFSIAAADGLTVDQLAANNGLAQDAQLITGSTIQIPPQDAAPSTQGAPTAPSAPSAPSGEYVVQPGDTLWAIAAQQGLTVEQLAAANGLDPNGMLVPGTTLSLSTAPAPAPESLSTAPAPAPTSAKATSVINGNQTLPGGGGGPYPTAQTLDAGTVGSIASGVGASPSLTQAVGQQESGFNNHVVSRTGAVGIMQIAPGTWNYINQVLTPGAPLDPYSATDNVKAGALLLRSLMNEAGGDPRLAAAGYHQGLQSVEQNGMHPSTLRYVRSVLALQQRYGGRYSQFDLRTARTR